MLGSYLPAIRYTYLNLDADVIFVPKRKIGDEFHYRMPAIFVTQCNSHDYERLYFQKSIIDNCFLLNHMSK